MDRPTRDKVSQAAAGPAVKMITDNARVAAATLQDRLKNAPRLRSISSTRRALDESTAEYAAADEQVNAAATKVGQAIAELSRHAAQNQAAAEHRLAQFAQSIADEVGKLPFQLVAPFDDDRWNQFAPAATPTTIAGPNGMLLRWGHASTDLPNAPGWLPFQALPLVGSGTGWVIAADEEAAPAVRGLLQALVMRIACQFPQRAKFTFLDPLERGLTFPMQRLLQPNVRASGSDLWQDLGNIEADITRILREVVHHHGSFENIPSEQQTAEKYEFIFAADFPKSRAYDRRVTEKLLEIGRVGPRAGRYLILHRVLGQDLPRDVNFEDFGKPKTITLRGSGPFVADQPPRAQLQEKILHSLEAAPQANRAKPLRDVLPPQSKWWASQATTHIEASLDGQKDGLEVFFGQRPTGGQTAYHGVLAAATGMGKSNLLHALILGLATRYSPDELQLYLLDLKQGVEFKAYETLPHAAVIAFNTDPALARAVLTELRQEAERRYRDIMIPSGTSDFRGYREVGQPNGRLPRILLVIDEYQALFQGGDPSAVSADLVNLAGQGRAAGVHILLGSQTFRAPGLQQAETLFTNLALRMALKMPPAAITAMTEFQTEGKRMLASCDIPGKLVLNISQGADGANRLGQVVEVRSDERQAVLARLDAMAQQVDEQHRSAWPRTETFDGSRARHPDENVLLLSQRAIGKPLDAGTIARLARFDKARRGFGMPEWRESDAAIPLVFGREYAVHGQAVAVLRRLPGQNLMILASSTGLRTSLTGALVDSLSALDQQVRGEIVLLNGSDDPAIVSILQRFGIPAAADAQAALSAAEAGPGLLILVEPERIPELMRSTDPLAPRLPLFDALDRRLREGAATGRHTIVITSAAAAITRVIPRRVIGQQFAWMVVGQMSQEDSQDLLGNRQASQLRDGARVGPEAALLADMAGNRFTRIAPFAVRS